MYVCAFLRLCTPGNVSVNLLFFIIIIFVYLRVQSLSLHVCIFVSVYMYVFFCGGRKERWSGEPLGERKRRNNKDRRSISVAVCARVFTVFTRRRLH